jgi:hypothetical protein
MFLRDHNLNPKEVLLSCSSYKNYFGQSTRAKHRRVESGLSAILGQISLRSESALMSLFTGDSKEKPMNNRAK